MIYKIGEVSDDIRGYEVFTPHNREQVAGNMTQENAELICRLLNNNIQQTTLEYPSQPVNTLETEQEYEIALERLSFLMDIPDRKFNFLLKNELISLSAVIEKYEQAESEDEDEEELTLRDHFAGVALNALIQAYPNEHEDWLSKNAYLTADSMLKARQQCS